MVSVCREERHVLEDGYSYIGTKGYLVGFELHRAALSRKCQRIQGVTVPQRDFSQSVKR